MPLEAGLARLSRDECMDLLAKASFGRVGVSVDALPAILPVTIAMMDGDVVFRTVPGTKFAYAARNAVLAIEVDDYDPDRGEGWSVLVRGVAQQMDDADEVARARSLLDPSWIPDDAGEYFVKVSSDLVTGRRLEHHNGHSAG
jgi:nitroimidazol reductase NimA-like FMN-containing flavoprotein (pyridoxamine 5'-phosphate oxidase superfamily)